MSQIAFQAVVNSPGEAEFYRTFLQEREYDVEVIGPFVKGIFDLKDVSTGTVVKAANCWIITGTKEAP